MGLNSLKIRYEYFKYRKKCVEKLPKMKLSMMKERDEIGTFAYTNNIEMEEAINKKIPIVFYYHNDLFAFLPQYRKAVLLHEFTHISDFIKFRKYKNVTMIMCTYSEFHATQIEFMSVCDIHTVTTKCKKPLDTIICYQDQKITIQEYMEILLAEVLAILNEDLSVLDENMQTANAAALIKHLMYFFGAISFYYDSQREMIYKYFSVFDKFGGYTDMFIKLYKNVVMKQSFRSNFDEYVNFVNTIINKYLGI